MAKSNIITLSRATINYFIERGDITDTEVIEAMQGLSAVVLINNITRDPDDPNTDVPNDDTHNALKIRDANVYMSPYIGCLCERTIQRGAVGAVYRDIGHYIFSVVKHEPSGDSWQPVGSTQTIFPEEIWSGAGLFTTGYAGPRGPEAKIKAPNNAVTMYDGLTYYATDTQRFFVCYGGTWVPIIGNLNTEQILEPGDVWMTLENYLELPGLTGPVGTHWALVVEYVADPNNPTGPGKRIFNWRQIVDEVERS